MTEIRRLQLRDAKATFSSVVNEAGRGEPTIITRHGQPAAVVLGYEAWQAMVRRVPSFGELLMSCPLEDGDLPPRSTGGLRDVEF